VSHKLMEIGLFQNLLEAAEFVNCNSSSSSWLGKHAL